MIFMIHYEIWKIWIRIKNHSREGSEEGQIFGDNEDEQVKKKYKLFNKKTLRTY